MGVTTSGINCVFITWFFAFPIPIHKFVKFFFTSGCDLSSSIIFKTCLFCDFFELILFRCLVVDYDRECLLFVRQSKQMGLIQ